MTQLTDQWHEPEPTGVNGVAIIGRGIDEKDGNLYEVTLTLQVDAATPEEASERAMQFRDRIGLGGPPWTRSAYDLPFHLHLHHPDGC